MRLFAGSAEYDAALLHPGGRCHRLCVKTGTFLVALLLIGCAGPDSGGTSNELDEGAEDEVGATRASRESVAAEELSTAAVAPGPAAPSAPAAPAPPFVARVVAATHGEDGRGEVVRAVSPIAFDLDARPFPVRALDPELHIGDLRFRNYTYPSPGVLRFIAADRAALPEGTEVAVSYRGEASSRVVVAPALVLP